MLRAAQFHEFAEQSLGWGRDGDVARIPDMPMQPVALTEVVRVLLELATEPTGRRGWSWPGRAGSSWPSWYPPGRGARGAVRVEPVPVSAAVRDGALLPGPDAVLAGPDFTGWLAERAA